MEALCDVRAKHLVVTCAPCGRQGVYQLDRLRRRYGEHTSMLDVYLRLTETCRYQREVGSRTPNVYGTACRAKLDTSGETGPRGALSSRT